VAYLSEIIGRIGGDFEAALSFGNDQAFRAHAVQQFAKRADTRAIALADLLQTKVRRRWGVRLI
jgi:hypothetical protein